MECGKPLPEILERMMEVVEKDCVPCTTEAIMKGSKLFGAAILRRDDLSLVCVGTNSEHESPIWHGEVHCIKNFWEIPKEKRPLPSECLLLATHEPCSMCTSAICWSGFPECFYLFTYEQTRDAFNIPHDIRMCKEVFNCDRPNQKHIYFQGYGIPELLRAVPEADKAALDAKYASLKATYDDLSALFNVHKNPNPPVILPGDQFWKPEDLAATTSS